MPLHVLMKASVAISIAGMPFFSISMLLSRPLELHDPQSPWVIMTTSHCDAPLSTHSLQEWW